MKRLSIDCTGETAQGAVSLIIIAVIYCEIARAAMLPLDLFSPASEDMMNDDDDYKVGYKRPPLHSRFRPGENRNPNGRRGKKIRPKRVEVTDAEIVAQLEAETVEFQGRRISKHEAMNRVLYAKALSGDLKAIAMIEAKKQKAGGARQNTVGGVLLIPAGVPLHEWEASAAIQQAQYREGLDTKAIDRELQKYGKDDE